MSLKSNIYGVLAFGLSAVMANACILTVRVACPNDAAAAGVIVCASSPNGDYCGVTDGLGIADIQLPGFDTYTVCVDTTTLPAGATLAPTCQKIKVISDAPPLMEFELGGNFCSVPPPPGPCWLTGGGTVDKTKGTPNYTFGGVVYPGCSPKAADGGNWNVVDHFTTGRAPVELDFERRDVEVLTLVDGYGGARHRRISEPPSPTSAAGMSSFMPV